MRDHLLPSAGAPALPSLPPNPSLAEAVLARARDLGLLAPRR